MECYQIEKINWERSNHKCLMVIKERISEFIQGAIPDCVSTLIKRLTTEKYFEGGVRYHILRMTNVAARLKPLDLAIKDGFLIYLIFNLLPKEFETFEVNYNSMNEKWTLEKFMAVCPTGGEDQE
jgi:hypothetical protein